MKKVLFDTNIILDVALKREPFVANSLKTINLIDTKIEGYVNILTLINTYYFAHKKVGIDKAKQFIADLLTQFKVINATKEICINAINSDFNDFEDAVQEFSAINADVEIIVTRNPKDFKYSNLKVFEPKELIKYFEK